MKGILKIIAVLILVTIIGGLSSLLFNYYLIPKMSANAFFSRLSLFKKATENVTIINKTEQVTIKEEDSVNKIASQAATSVVNIISISTAKNGNTPAFLLEKSRSGTGVILTSDGLIATYRDVIMEKEAGYKVLTHNGSSYDAVLAGVDEFTNLAYLKIEASNLPAIGIANSSDFYPGKKLIAIGNAFQEYQNRFSSGLMSNINKTFNLAGKTVSSSEKLEGIFETDFAEQDEYAGGAVINYNGELVGLIGRLVIDNQKKYFQIPSNVLKKSMDLAIKKELGARPVLGIYYTPITKVYAMANSLDRDRGALIYSPSGKQGLAIISGSSAEKAGLQINDIIIAVGAQEVNLDNPLSNILSGYKKGDGIELLVIRNGKELKAAVDL